MQGWISLHRKLMDNPIWSDPNYLKLWIYCLFKASHKEHEQLVGNQIVKLERGQFITGRKVLAYELNHGVKPSQALSEKSWERHLKCLEKWQMLTIKVTNKYSIVTIDKYDFYQSFNNGDDQQNDQQLTSSCPASDQQLTTNNNVNKVNKEKHSVYSDEFESFWKEYPKKVDKKGAFEKFKQAIKRHSVETVIQGSKDYAKECQIKQVDKQYIKHPKTFLHNDSFLNEFETKVNVGTHKKQNRYEPNPVWKKNESEEMLKRKEELKKVVNYDDSDIFL